jgi:hypothetical protein
MPAQGGRRGGDVVEILQQIMQMLADAMSAPDAAAHMQVIQALQQGIAQYIQADRQQVRQQATQGGQGGPGGPGGGGPPGMAGGGGAGMGMGGGPPGGAGGPGGGAMPPRQIGPGGGAGMSGFGTPNPDELRRTLAGPAAVGGRAF